MWRYFVGDQAFNAKAGNSKANKNTSDSVIGTERHFKYHFRYAFASNARDSDYYDNNRRFRTVIRHLRFVHHQRVAQFADPIQTSDRRQTLVPAEPQVRTRHKYTRVVVPKTTFVVWFVI